MECFPVGEPLHASGKHQFPLLESVLETGNELAAKNTAQHFYRKEERVTRANPTLMIGRQITGRDHAMNMWVVLKVLAPGVEHTQETDLRAEMFGISSNLQQSRRAGANR